MARLGRRWRPDPARSARWWRHPAGGGGRRPRSGNQGSQDELQKTPFSGGRFNVFSNTARSRESGFRPIGASFFSPGDHENKLFWNSKCVRFGSPSWELIFVILDFCDLPGGASPADIRKNKLPKWTPKTTVVGAPA